MIWRNNRIRQARLELRELEEKKRKSLAGSEEEKEIDDLSLGRKPHYVRFAACDTGD